MFLLLPKTQGSQIKSDQKSPVRLTTLEQHFLHFFRKKIILNETNHNKTLITRIN